MLLIGLHFLKNILELCDQMVKIYLKERFALKYKHKKCMNYISFKELGNTLVEMVWYNINLLMSNERFTFEKLVYPATLPIVVCFMYHNPS